MANNKMVQLMRRELNKGVEMGTTAMEFAVLIAADNVLKDYFEDEQLAKVLKELEAEAQRVWAETVQDSGGKKDGADEVAQRLVIYSERIRRMRGMDE